MNGVSINGSNVIFKFNESYVTVKGDKETTKKYTANQTYSISDSSKLDVSNDSIWFADNENFLTDDMQFDLISKTAEVNYSPDKYEHFGKP